MSRAGRHLPSAIGVGVGLGLLVAVPLFLYRPVFVGVVVAGAALGGWELSRALHTVGTRPTLVPLLAGGVALDVVAYTHGADALWVGLLLTVLACLLWRLPGPPPGYWRDITAAAFVAVYVPFLAGFALLLARPDDGALRVFLFIVAVVCSDVGGYAAGVLSGGRHKIIPAVSPGKSWEGFAGSSLACVAAGVVGLTLFFDGALWWQGVVFGLAVVCSATLGDLGESMIKRDIGIKDMGNLLPGHGGMMDRLDSLLPTAPVAWLLLTAFVPPTG